jgi:coproporphyrinogen III oxidase-like Fe-S oxidoreductase
MGLRLAEGVPATALLAAGVAQVRLQELAGRGLLALSPERVSTTAAGRPLLNAVIRELLRDAVPMAVPINNRARSGPAVAQSPSDHWA